MKDPRLLRLMAVERLRKFREDQGRLELSASTRNFKHAEAESQAHGAKLVSHGDMRSDLAGKGGSLDITRFALLSELIRVGQEDQEALDAVKAEKFQLFEFATASVSDSWRNRAAVENKRLRYEQELAKQREEQVMLELSDLWLARRQRHVS